MKERVLIKSYVFENNAALIGLSSVLICCLFLCCLGTYVSSCILINGTYEQSDKFTFWFGVILTFTSLLILYKFYKIIRFYLLPISIEQGVIIKKGTEIVHGTKYDHTGYFIYFNNDKLDLSDKRWNKLNKNDQNEVEYKSE